MTTLKTTISASVALALIAFAPRLAQAEDFAQHLSKADLATLQKAVTRARRQVPRAFAQLDQLRDHIARVAQMGRQGRGRFPSFVRPLRALGRPALMPMLSLLFFEQASLSVLPARVSRGLKISLVEAIGSLRDRRAQRPLEAILVAGAADPLLAKAAAIALGRLATAQVAVTLQRYAMGDVATLRLAAVAGLGECRRPDAAAQLRELLNANRDRPELQRAVLAALGQVANPWAWQTPAVAKQGSAQQTRSIAEAAIRTALPSLSAAVRPAAEKALALINLQTSR